MPSREKFRIDVDMHDLLMDSSKPLPLSRSQGLELPEPRFPQYSTLLNDPGPTPAKRQWGHKGIYRTMREWLFP